MRDAARCLLTSFLLLLSLSAIIQGCAGPVLRTYSATDREIASVEIAFARFLEITQETCSCCLDAEADAALAVSGWFSDHTGRLSGYLQAMEPGYLRFVAVNPLGQPLLILASDGKIFKYLDILHEKAYIGSVDSAPYRKFAPPGFEPGFSYYWLTGRMQPGEIQIAAVKRGEERDTFWLKINHSGSDTESMVLFAPEDMVILRHVLLDGRGKIFFDIRYTGYQLLERTKKSTAAGGRSDDHAGLDPAEGKCRVPAGVSVSSRKGAERIAIELRSFLSDVYFTAADFHIDIPANFEQLLVK